MSHTVRPKEYDLKAGDVRRIKIVDIEAPIRFVVDSGAFTYEVLVGTSSAGAAAAITSGVLTAPGGAWGTEVEIVCTTTGVLKAAHVG